MTLRYKMQAFFLHGLSHFKHWMSPSLPELFICFGFASVVTESTAVDPDTNLFNCSMSNSLSTFKFNALPPDFTFELDLCDEFQASPVP